MLSKFGNFSEAAAAPGGVLDSSNESAAVDEPSDYLVLIRIGTEI